MEELSTLETSQILDLTEDVVKTRLQSRPFGRPP
jgi:DNA-directed RNA polymerase specialized sigma24 family protein